jgi:hypothetical protein
VAPSARARGGGGATAAGALADWRAPPRHSPRARAAGGRMTAPPKLSGLQARLLARPR